jgi:diguanylate cyclase (GGDEF)-like protein
VRWGGEELLVVVRFVGRAHAGELAEKLRQAVASHPFALPDGRTIARTCSIGAASWPFSRNAPDALTWQEVLGIADAALYLVKENGRNGWMQIEAPAGCTAPRDAAAHFRDDARGAIARGEVIASSCAVAR